MNVEAGWRFNAADFSINASGKFALGQVRFVRDPEERRRWHEQSEELIESDDCPPLYVTGEGMTIEEAFVNANLAASHAEPIIDI